MPYVPKTGLLAHGQLPPALKNISCYTISPEVTPVTQLNPSLRSNNDNLERFPILIAARRWGPRWTNKRLCIDTDNTQAMAFINSGTCKNSLAMSWLREFSGLASDSISTIGPFTFRANLIKTLTDLLDYFNILSYRLMALMICFRLLRISFRVGIASQVCLRRCLCMFHTSYTPLSVASVSTLLLEIWFSTCPSNSQHCHSFPYPLVYLLEVLYDNKLSISHQRPS